MSNRKGFRGYMGARMEMGRSTPQHIQQAVMRDYCAQRHMTYLLAATEYCMPGCTMILDAVLDELDSVQGIVMYSLFLFPQSREKRMDMYRRLFDKGCTLHTAAEGIVLSDWQDAMRIEDVWLVHEAMHRQSSETTAYLKQWDSEHAAC